MIEEIKAAAKAGDSLGGLVEVLGYGVPVGLGSHVHWDRKLDAQLAGALMSIQAVKGVDIGEEPEGIGSVRAGLHLRRVEERQKRRLPGLPISDDYDVRHGLPVRGTPRRRVVLILWKSLLEPSNRDRSGEGSGLVALNPEGFVTEFLPGDVPINVTLKRQVFSSARAIRVPR